VVLSPYAAEWRAPPISPPQFAPSDRRGGRDHGAYAAVCSPEAGRHCEVPVHYLRTDAAQPSVVCAGPYQAADGLSLETKPAGNTAAEITGGADNENHDRSTSSGWRCCSE
jgi:hypothetical protein